MFGRSKVPNANVPRGSVPGELQVVQPVSPDNGGAQGAGAMLAHSQTKPPTKDYSVLESVDGDGLVLIGKNTRLVGEITNCTNVEVQGALEGTLIADSIVVREGGTVKGTVKTTNASVLGTVEGEVAVTGLLDVKSTGQVTGDISYGQFSVQVGGHISGQLDIASPEGKVEHVEHLSASAGAPGSATNGSGYKLPHFDNQEDSA